MTKVFCWQHCGFVLEQSWKMVQFCFIHVFSKFGVDVLHSAISRCHIASCRNSLPVMHQVIPESKPFLFTSSHLRVIWEKRGSGQSIVAMQSLKDVLRTMSSGWV